MLIVTSYEKKKTRGSILFLFAKTIIDSEDDAQERLHFKNLYQCGTYYLFSNLSEMYRDAKAVVLYHGTLYFHDLLFQSCLYLSQAYRTLLVHAN